MANTHILSATAVAASCLLAPMAQAGNLEPSGLNLGNTSFFDGFGASGPGWTYLGYLQHGRYDHIVDNGGHDVAAFEQPRIDTTLLVSQVAYATDQLFFDDTARLGFNVIVPLTSLDASFAAASPAQLKAHSGLGDINLGATLQFRPVIEGGRPVYSQRLEVAVIAPTGRYSDAYDINPGSHFWTFAPNWAATWLPTPRTEVSWRLNYIYNFNNSKPANLPPTVTDTRAGQAAWLNFTASYAVLPNLNVGINGYTFHQLTSDRYRYADGSSDAGVQFGDGGKARVTAVGPGLSWKMGSPDAPTEVLNLNFYTQVQARNRTRGNVLNLNWIHPF